MKVGCFYKVEPISQSQHTQRHRHKQAMGHQALRAKDMRYFCDIAEADDFAPLLWATGCQVHADLAAEILFVCDGAKWIWCLIETYDPQAIQILDWYPAEERLEKVAQDLFPTDQAQAWLATVLTAMWEGNTTFVIAACESLAAKSEIAAQALTYFRNNAHRMPYHKFREQGSMIGSGTVESGCKQIVTQRLKRAGAQWNLQGARLTAKARAAWLSGDWEDLCSRRDQLPLAV
jgi:hypothetical protein